MPEIKAPIPELRLVKHACRTSISKYRRKEQTETIQYRVVQAREKIDLLESFLARLPETKYGKADETE